MSMVAKILERFRANSLHEGSAEIQKVAETAQEGLDRQRQREARREFAKQQAENARQFVEEQYPAIMEEEGLNPHSLRVCQEGHSELQSALPKEIRDYEIYKGLAELMHRTNPYRSNIESLAQIAEGGPTFSAQHRGSGTLRLQVAVVIKDGPDYSQNDKNSREFLSEAYHGRISRDTYHYNLHTLDSRECECEDAMGAVGGMLMKDAYNVARQMHGQKFLIEGESAEKYTEQLRRIAERLDGALDTNEAAKRLDEVITDEKQVLDERQELERELQAIRHFKQDQQEAFDTIQEYNEQHLGELSKFENLDNVEVRWTETNGCIVSVQCGGGKDLDVSIEPNASIDADYNIEGRSGDFRLAISRYSNPPVWSRPALDEVFSEVESISGKIAQLFGKKAEGPKYHVDHLGAHRATEIVGGAIAAVHPERETEIRRIKDDIEQSLYAQEKKAPSEERRPA